jgi:hypothetical protein
MDKKNFERRKPRPHANTPRDHAPLARQKYDAQQSEGRIVTAIN